MIALKRLGLAPLAAVLLCAGPACATPIDSATGIPGASTITFGTADYADGTVITSQYAPQGLANAGGLFYGTTKYANAFPPSNGAYLTNVDEDDPSIVVPNFTLQFTLQHGAVDFVIATIPTPTTLTASRLSPQATTSPFTLSAYLGTRLVETYAASANGARYYGFSGVAFDRIVVESGSTRLLIDSVQFAPLAVPEPSTVALMLVGLTALFGLARRRVATAVRRR